MSSPTRIENERDRRQLYHPYLRSPGLISFKSSACLECVFESTLEKFYKLITQPVTLATRIIALYHSSRHIIMWVVGCGTILAGITCVSLLFPLWLLMTHYLRL